MRGLALALAVALAAAQPCRAGKFDAEETGSLIRGLKFSGLLDLRFYRTSREVSWLRGGANKLRYGGRDTDANGPGDRAVAGAAVPQASVVVDAEVSPAARVHVQANFSTDASSGSGKIGIIEAYADAEKAFENDALKLRAGDFIPLISWEHPDAGWSTRYTLTPSAIGSWVGEEIRVLGAEGSWQRRLTPSAQARLTGGAFSGGDQIGRLLWFRGFSLHDYQAEVGQQYGLQSRSYGPFEELDGRLGYYGRADLSVLDRSLRLGGGYWTNNGDERLGQAGAANLGTQAFRTRLFHYGGAAEWRRWTFLAQYMKATVSAVDKPARDWTAAYALASVALGSARLSARYDRYWVLNWENGHALTGFLAWNFSLRQQLGLEFVYANARSVVPLRPQAQVDRLTQLNYRLRF